jgi:serine/threonine protein phosphatase PrpC
MGELAISRSIGDRPFAQYLSREPGVSVVKLQRGVHRFVVIASDGVWDVMSDDEAVRMVEEVLAVHWDQSGSLGGSAGVLACEGAFQAAATAIAHEAYVRGSSDNIGCAVIDLAPAAHSGGGKFA